MDDVVLTLLLVALGALLAWRAEARQRRRAMEVEGHQWIAAMRRVR